MKKWKWIKGSIIALISTAVIATSGVILFWNVDAPTPINTYGVWFSSSKNSNTEIVNAKNNLITNLTNQTSEVINNYFEQNKTKSNDSLVFNFANLTVNQTQGERNYFTSLNRSLKSISPYLGIDNKQRTAKLINDAFYNKNTELMSFYWSPDYNSVGTWLKYMFTDIYTMPNMWPSTFSILENHANDYVWANSLKTYLMNFNIPNTNEPLYKSPIEILEYIASNENVNKIHIDDYYVNIANAIGTWVSENSELEITKVNEPNYNGQDYYLQYQSQLPLGIEYVNWIASQNPNIPYQEVGAGTSVPYLVTNGIYMPENPNSNINFRDWYYYSNIFNGKVVKDWWDSDPFESNETAWNGPFSKSPNQTYANSTWITLTSWTTRGDENDSNFLNQTDILVSNGMMNDITDENVYAQLENEFNNEQTLTLDIRPIPWVDANGKTTNYYLSPYDFWCGFKAFYRSIENGVNANNAYIIGLAAIDFEKTLNYEPNKAINKSTNEHQSFKIFFNDPILSLRDTLDIFQKQYFAALPHAHEKVQNIVDDQKYNQIAVNFPGSSNLDMQSTDITKFYGVGVGYQKSVWGDLWSAGSYYVSNADRQSITYKINEEYFKSFNELKNKQEYVSFLRNNQTNKGNISKISEINLKYAGSYNLDILYEQFKAGELNKAKLQSVTLLEVINSSWNKNLRYQTTQKISKSNTIGFNLQIYEKWTEPSSSVPAGYNPAENIIVDTNNNPMWDPVTRKPTYTIDEWGNYVWPEGKLPKIKSEVSQAYADLIVSDFYTPITEGGKSQLIRFTIMNTINWVSLKSLVTPGISSSVQYSFMPYGVYDLYNADMSIRGTYWDLAANKRYLTDEQLNNTFDEASIKLRLSGNSIWTYEELLNAMIKID